MDKLDAEVVCKALQKPSTHLLACKILAGASHSPILCERFLQHGVISHFVKAISQYTTDATPVQENPGGKKTLRAELCQYFSHFLLRCSLCTDLHALIVHDGSLFNTLHDLVTTLGVTSQDCMALLVFLSNIISCYGFWSSRANTTSFLKCAYFIYIDLLAAHCGKLYPFSVNMINEVLNGLVQLSREFYSNTLYRMCVMKLESVATSKAFPCNTEHEVHTRILYLLDRISKSYANYGNNEVDLWVVDYLNTILSTSTQVEHQLLAISCLCNYSYYSTLKVRGPEKKGEQFSSSGQKWTELFDDQIIITFMKESLEQPHIGLFKSGKTCADLDVLLLMNCIRICYNLSKRNEGNAELRTSVLEFILHLTGQGMHNVHSLVNAVKGNEFVKYGVFLCVQNWVKNSSNNDLAMLPWYKKMQNVNIESIGQFIKLHQNLHHKLLHANYTLVHGTAVVPHSSDVVFLLNECNKYTTGDWESMFRYLEVLYIRLKYNSDTVIPLGQLPSLLKLLNGVKHHIKQLETNQLLNRNSFKVPLHSYCKSLTCVSYILEIIYLAAVNREEHTDALNQSNVVSVVLDAFDAINYVNSELNKYLKEKRVSGEFAIPFVPVRSLTIKLFCMFASVTTSSLGPFLPVVASVLDDSIQYIQRYNMVNGIESILLNTLMVLNTSLSQGIKKQQQKRMFNLVCSLCRGLLTVKEDVTDDGVTSLNMIQSLSLRCLSDLMLMQVGAPYVVPAVCIVTACKLMSNSNLIPLLLDCSRFLCIASSNRKQHMSLLQCIDSVARATQDTLSYSFRRDVMVKLLGADREMKQLLAYQPSNDGSAMASDTQIIPNWIDKLGNAGNTAQPTALLHALPGGPSADPITMTKSDAADERSSYLVTRRNANSLVIWQYSELFKYLVCFIANISVSDAIEVSLVENGVQDKLVQKLEMAIEIEKSNASVQHSGPDTFLNVAKWLTAALSNLTNLPNPQTRLVTNGGIDAILHLLKLHDNDITVNSITVLCNACHNMTVCQQCLAKTPIFNCSLEALWNKTDLEVRRRGIQLLAVLCGCSAFRNVEFVDRHSLIKHLYLILYQQLADLYTHYYIAAALSNLVVNGAADCVVNSVHQLEDVSLGLHCLYTLCKSPFLPVQTVAAQTLCAIAEDERLHYKVRSSGGVDLLIDLARRAEPGLAAPAGRALSFFFSLQPVTHHYTALNGKPTQYSGKNGGEPSMLSIPSPARFTKPPVPAAATRAPPTFGAATPSTPPPVTQPAAPHPAYGADFRGQQHSSPPFPIERKSQCVLQ